MDPIIFVAILSPLLFGFANIFDKYVVSHRVKNPLGYTVVTGLISITLGLLLAIFLDWKMVGLDMLLFPIFTGGLYGIIYYFYFFIIQKHDASYMVGFLYLFPIVVAILSFIFLKERLSVLVYLSVIIILLGVVLLSVRAKKINLKLLLGPLLVYVILLGTYEFFIKISTENLPFLNGLAIATFVSGITILFGLFSKKIRIGFKNEFKNLKWALLGEFLSVIAVLTLFLAMSRMSATVVSAIAATQPLFLLFFERIAHKRFGKITQDQMILPKLIAISLIVLGVIFLIILNG